MKRGELNDPHRIKLHCLMSIEKMSIEKIDSFLSIVVIKTSKRAISSDG